MVRGYDGARGATQPIGPLTIHRRNNPVRRGGAPEAKLGRYDAVYVQDGSTK
jgi:hypothetical protein